MSKAIHTREVSWYVFDTANKYKTIDGHKINDNRGQKRKMVYKRDTKSIYIYIEVK